MTPTPDPQRSPRPRLPATDPDAERACRLSTAAWVWRSTRGEFPSHLARLHALEAAGLVPDEAYFARMAEALP